MYIGGKFRQGKEIARVVDTLLEEGGTYVEPFCGALGSAERVVPKISDKAGEIILSGVSESLINMWKQVMAGWLPPEIVPLETWQQCKDARDPSDPMTAYCGFALSFMGRYFAKYKPHNEEYLPLSHKSRRKSLERKKKALEGRDFKLRHGTYDQLHIPDGAVVYADPPYATGADVSKSYDVADFDHDKFWAWAENLSGRCTVVVSEFEAPQGWVPIYSWGNTVMHVMRDGKNRRDVKDSKQESLFMLADVAGRE